MFQDHITRRSLSTVALLSLAGLAAAPATAQCIPEWDPTIGQPGALSPFVINEMIVWDDGRGPALYVSGAFSSIGGVAAASIARWDGNGFEALGSGLTFGVGLSRVTGLAVYDDGTGPALYAGGNFNTAGGVPANRVAKWNGSTWSPVGLGTDQQVFKLHVFRGSLYAGGFFSSAGGGVPGTAQIARWDGSNWHSVGGGVSGGTVNCFLTHDDGSGESLFVGGRFTFAGAVPASLIARWDGTNWHAVGSGLSGGETRVNAMTAFDDGSGMKLWATGDFLQAGALNVERLATWDGANWSAPPGPGVDSTASALTVFDDGNGEKLYIGGSFVTVGGVLVNRLASWDGSQWADLDGGLLHASSVTTVSVMREFDDGHGRGLFVGGGFTNAGTTQANSIAKWVACEQPCYPDCDTSTGPGVLDILDFLCFGNRFTAGDPYACDCDLTTGPGVCDIFDFLCFSNAFSVGCP